MLIHALRLSALGLVLGFLIGPLPTGQEPEAPASVLLTGDPPGRQVSLPDRVPYADSPQPVHLDIPALEVSARIQPVGMTDAVTMQVPSDISVVGWFHLGVLPVAEAGHTVLVGHRDGESDPNGVFRNLGRVRPGDELTVRDQSGRLLHYQVREIDVLGDRQFARRAPWVFRTDGPHRLVLITCGGTFDEARGGYQANVVVVAKRI